MAIPMHSRLSTVKAHGTTRRESRHTIVQRGAAELDLLDLHVTGALAVQKTALVLVLLDLSETGLNTSVCNTSAKRRKKC